MPDIYKASEKPKAPEKKVSKKKFPSKSKEARELREEIYRLAGERGGSLSAFVGRPKGASFETQMDQEEIIVMLRRHWLTNVSWIIVAGIMFIAPSLLPFIPFLDFLPVRFQFFALVLWYLLVIAFVLERFLSWYFNVNIITDERIVDIDFFSLIYKEISDAEIEQVQDITMVMGGFLRTMFNFGTIYIQTAAEKPRFEFEDVPNPSQVVKILEKMGIEEKQEALEGRLR